MTLKIDDGRRAAAPPVYRPARLSTNVIAVNRTTPGAGKIPLQQLSAAPAGMPRFGNEGRPADASLMAGVPSAIDKTQPRPVWTLAIVDIGAMCVATPRNRYSRSTPRKATCCGVGGMLQLHPASQGAGAGRQRLLHCSGCGLRQWPTVRRPCALHPGQWEAVRRDYRINRVA